jgi:hypothetical protein
VLVALALALACKTPARFEITSLDITSKEIATGQSAIARASVVNVGQTEGTYHAVLMINGIEIEAKDEDTISAYIQKLGFSKDQCKSWSFFEVADYYKTK